MRDFLYFLSILLKRKKSFFFIRSLFKGRDFLLWNIRGLFDLQTNAQLLDASLADTLDFFLQDDDSIQKKIVILTSVHNSLEDENVTERLKLLAQKINSGALSDCTFIIISPTIKIPVSLEKYINL